MDKNHINLPLDEWSNWLQQVMQPAALIQLAVIVGSAALAWLLVRQLQKILLAGPQENAIPDAAEEVLQRVSVKEESLFFGNKGYDGVLFPFIWLIVTYLATYFMNFEVSKSLFRIALPVITALVVIRSVARIVHRLWGDKYWVRVLENTVSWLIWGCVVLWVIGLLPDFVKFLDGFSLKFGAIQTTLLDLILGGVFVVLALLVALWLSSLIEARLLRNATGSTLSLRKIGSNAIRGLLLFLAVILGLEAVNIDLTVFSVFGGALGVGVGLGLQKLAANYVSGFVVLLERSVRIGDLIKVGNFEGRVTDITARFTRVRSVTGVEAILPNDMLVNQQVENSSLKDPRIWHWLPVTVTYTADVELVQRLLVEAALSHPRIAKDPKPAAHLNAFGENGLEFRITFWVLDPENGMASLRSAVNLQIWHAFKEHGIQIAYPQRVMRKAEDEEWADQMRTAAMMEQAQTLSTQAPSALQTAGAQTQAEQAVNVENVGHALGGSPSAPVSGAPNDSSVKPFR